MEVLRRPAAGSSTATHTYAGHDPRLLSGTRYYRLRQVDVDGRTSYSPVVAVMGAETGLALYPNLVTDQLQGSGPATAGRLLLRDLAGRVVNRIELKPGPNEVDVAHLPPDCIWWSGLIVTLPGADDYRNGRVSGVAAHPTVSRICFFTRWPAAPAARRRARDARQFAGATWRNRGLFGPVARRGDPARQYYRARARKCGRRGGWY